MFQNGDLDFDGQPYYPDWPTGTRTTKWPSTFVESFPTTNGHQQYSQFFMQTDIALSETSCLGNSYGGGTSSGCTVPPQGPGNFYPYWTEAHGFGNSCVLEFGNVSGDRPFITDFGKDAQYGTNLFSTLGYPEFEGAIHHNTCRHGQFR